MPYAYSFDNWDPWDDARLPDTLPWSLKDVRDRACAILVGQRQGDMQRASNSIYKMVVRGTMGAMIEAIEQMKVDGKDEKHTSDFHALRVAVASLNLEVYPLIPNARPADYFAVFSLSAIGELINIQLDLKKRGSESAPFSYDPITAELTTAATESIAFAEQLLREASLTRESRAYTGRVGGLKRANRFAALRNECLCRGSEHLDAPSALKAANLVYDSLESEWLDQFQSKEVFQRIDTITRWLRKEFKFTKR